MPKKRRQITMFKIHLISLQHYSLQGTLNIDLLIYSKIDRKNLKLHKIPSGFIANKYKLFLQF